MVDTDGRALVLQVTPASVQDRDGAVPLLQAYRASFPFVERVFANSAYAAERVANATRIVVEIVRKLPNQVGLVVLPRHWVVERFLARINRNRRLAKDFGRTIASAAAFLYAWELSIRQMRNLLRLHRDGVSALEIGRLLRVARSTIQDSWKRAAAAGLRWPLPDDATDDALERLLFGRTGAAPGQRRRTEPDCAQLAREAVSTKPGLDGKRISPHIFRHSLAIRLLRSGVDLLTIQAWLGHAQVATTHRYAAADVEMMRRGLEKAGVSNDRSPCFRPNDAVLQLLASI